MIKSRNFAKMLVIMFVVFLGSVNVALAVPTLQLYSPDATYFDEYYVDDEYVITESWFIYSNSFDLQVLGATQPNGVTVIENVKLHFAVPEEYFRPDGSIHILGEGIDITIAGGDMKYGHPADLSQPHGIYDTYYYSVELPDLEVGTAGDTIFDYNENYTPGNPGKPDTGAIQYYEVSYENYFLIHMDLTGRAMKYNENGELLNSWDRFAPFSHDADAVVPEPATMFLVGTGLIGLGWKARRKLKK
jgi:hypothetical protein